MEENMKRKQMISTMVLSLVFFAASAFAAPPIKVLQASKGPPPEVQAMQKEKAEMDKAGPPRAQKPSAKELGRTNMKYAAKGPPPEVQAMQKEKAETDKAGPPRTKRLT